MLHFYGDILGMKNLFTLTMGDLMVSMEERMGDAESQEKLKEMSEEQRRELKQRKESMKAVADKPWITYMKLADRPVPGTVLRYGQTHGACGGSEEKLRLYQVEF